MTVVVIGATGFIGTELTAANREVGNRVIGCGRKAWEGQIVEQFPSKEDYWSTADGDLPTEYLQAADCLVLLAAKRPYPGFCFEDYSDNVAVAHKYIKLAMDHGLNNIVFASSKAVYSGPNMPWREDDVCTPSSLYGASKLAVEQLGAYYNTVGNLCFKSLRFAQVIGGGERKGYLISTLIDNARNNRVQTVYGTGEQRRQYVYVKDVATAIMTAENRPEIRGSFNMGMRGSVSNLEMVQIANECFKSSGGITHDYNRPMVGSNDEMCVEKAEKELGFRAQYGIRETFYDLAKSMK